MIYVHLLSPIVFFIVIQYKYLAIATLSAIIIPLLLRLAILYYQERNGILNYSSVGVHIGFVPFTIFLIARQFTDLYSTTLVAIGTSILILPIERFMIKFFKKEMIPMQGGIYASTLLMYGGIALLAKNSHFIAWEPSMAYALLLLSSIISTNESR